MKRLASLIVTFAIATLLMACGAQVSESTTPVEGGTGTPVEEANEPTSDGQLSLQEQAATDGADSDAEKQDASEGDQLETELSISKELSPYVPDGIERAVIGSDNRVTVSDTYQYPFSAIALLNGEFSCGCTMNATGFMVNRKVLLTASHCLYCSDHHKPIESLEFLFGYRPDGSYGYLYDGPFRYEYGTNFPGGYTNENMRWDYGFVRFPENVGDTTGWFGVEVLSDKDFEKGTFTVAGYRDGLLKYDTNTTTVENKELVTTKIDAVAGNSGGPLYRGTMASAIHIAENSLGMHNTARRITEDVFDMILDLENGPYERTEAWTGKDGGKDDSAGNDTDAAVRDPSSVGKDGYVLPYATSRRYTRDEVSWLSNWGLYIARNEIYARHEYSFKNQDLRDYFGGKSWYHGKYASDEWARMESKGPILNDVETDNVNMLLQLERERGSTYAP